MKPSIAYIKAISMYVAFPILMENKPINTTVCEENKKDAAIFAYLFFDTSPTIRLNIRENNKIIIAI